VADVVCENFKVRQSNWETGKLNIVEGVKRFSWKSTSDSVDARLGYGPFK
jgi:hypothetical protein